MEVGLDLSRKKSIAALVMNVNRVIAYGNGRAEFLDVTWDGAEAELANAGSAAEKLCKAGFRKFTAGLVKALPGLRAVRNFERGLRNTQRLHEHLVTDRPVADEILERCQRGTGIGIIHRERVWDKVEPSRRSGDAAACGAVPDRDGQTLAGYLAKEMRKSYHRSDHFTGRRWAAIGNWEHVKARAVLYQERLVGVTGDGSERVLPAWREIYGELMQMVAPRSRWDWERARKLAENRARREFDRWVEAGVIELVFEELYSVKDAAGNWVVELKDGWRLPVEEVRARAAAGKKLPGVMLGASWEAGRGDAHEGEGSADVQVEGAPF